MKPYLLALLALCPLASWSQEFRATLSGVVSDVSGSAVAGAKVTATETNTNTRTDTVADSSGHYTVPFLLPGDYTLSVRVDGFKEFRRPAFHVNAGENPVVDVTLQVGDTSQTVEVTADIPQINVENGAVGSTITAKEVENLPLNGGTPIMMASLAIGVISTAQPSEVQPFSSGGGASWSIGGSPSQTNELLLDGVPNGTWDGRLAYSPPRDAVAEVRPKVFETDASFGHSGAGTINQILKAGTNRITGSLYESNKPNNLVANNFFNNKNSLPVPVTHYNQFGGTLGGPLYIPKLFNGRDKVFWFFAAEGMQLSQPGTTFMSVPNDAERTGDFSKLLKAGTQLYNPYTATLNGTIITRQPFPNNIIPANLLSPIAQKYLQFFPRPNIVTTRADEYDNYGSNAITKDGYTNQLGRLDINLSPRLRTYFNVRHTEYAQSKNNYYDNIATGSNLSRANWGTTLDQVFMVNASNILNWRVNFTRMFEDHSAPSAGFNPASIGFPGYLAANSQYMQLPVIAFATASSDFQTIGQTGANTLPSQSLQALGSWSTVRGGHQIKTGVDARQYRLNIINYGSATGQLSFSANDWVRQASNSSSSVAKGQDLAEFLLGLPTSGAYDINSSAMYYQYYFAGFIQDDWRIRRNLSINLGLRYDRDLPYHERWGRTNNGFAFEQQNPLSAAATAAYKAAPSALLPPDQFKVNGGLTFATPADNAIYRTSSRFSPRLGFAWTPDLLKGKTVFRGGFGMFASPLPLSTLQPTGAYSTNPLQTQSGFSQSTTLRSSNDNYLTPYATMADPFPGGITRPNGSADGLLTFAGQPVKFMSPKMDSPYAMRWTFGFQHTLDNATVLDVVYTGNRARNLPITYTQLNALPVDMLSTLPVRDQAKITALTATVANPFKGLQTSQSTSNTIQINQLLARYPEFPNGNSSPGSGGVVAHNQTIGSSAFQSLNARISRKFSGGLQFTFNYLRSTLIEQSTWLNPGDTDLEQRISPFDRPHAFTFGGVYELPFGRKFHVPTRVLRMVVSDWKLSSTYKYQVGGPIAWANGSTNNPGDYVYLGAPLNLDPRKVDGPAFDITAFKTASTDQFQFHKRYFATTFPSLRADGINDLNGSLMKDLPIGERVRFQLRAEVYNVMNHASFSTPNVQLNNSQFGVITTQANRPRSLLFMGRLTF